MSNQIQNTNQFLLYSDPNGDVRLEVLVQRPAVTKHLRNIFEDMELDEGSVCSILEHTANEKKTYSTKFYNLDAIISVGYRVNMFHNGILFGMLKNIKYSFQDMKKWEKG